MNATEVHEHVKERYGKIAQGAATSCCGGGTCADTVSKAIGYSDEELQAAPEGANLGLGCGNPLALAGLREGDTVLDLGSGAGFDCFLAARRVGASGRVIGVDMTEAMLQKARENAVKGGFTNVEFRKGQIENLPIDSASVDVVISNCVINLSPDKPRVFAETFRVLKPGGRAFISDIVLLRDLPERVRQNIGAYTACIGGAMTKEAYLGLIRDAGFGEVKVMHEAHYPVEWITGVMSNEQILEFRDMPREEVAAIASSLLSLYVQMTK